MDIENLRQTLEQANFASLAALAQVIGWMAWPDSGRACRRTSRV